MAKKSDLATQIVRLLNEKRVVTPNSASECLTNESNEKISPSVTSMKLYRLWKEERITRSLIPIMTPRGRKEYVYGLASLKEETIKVEFYGKKQEVTLMGYMKKLVNSRTRTSIRTIVKGIFNKQKAAEPLFPYEIGKIMNEKYNRQVSKITLSSTLLKMVKRGELARKGGFEFGHIFHPDPQIIDKWTQDFPFKGLSQDEKYILQLVRENLAITSNDIRTKAAKGESDLPSAYATILWKLEKLKRHIPWLRTEQHGSLTIIYNNQANPQTLKKKLDKIKFWQSEDGRRRRLFGHEFEDYMKYVLCDIVQVKRGEWAASAINVERNKKGRFGGEFDLIIEFTLGPPEFALGVVLVFEFKASGRVMWNEVFGFDPLLHSLGFMKKVEAEKRWNGLFHKKFVKPILVAANTVDRGIQGEIEELGGNVIYISQVRKYLERIGVNQDDIVKIIKAKYYKPPKRRYQTQASD